MALDEELRRREEVLDSLLKDQQRVEGIIHLCTLDEALERLLKAMMIDDKTVDGLMDDGRALQPFSIKLSLAYALGLIPDAVKGDLYYLNKIRNKFAHSADADSFDSRQIQDLCGNLSTSKAVNGDLLDPIQAFRLASVKCSLFLAGVAKRKESAKAEGQKQQLDLLQSEYEKINQCLTRRSR